MVQDALFVTQSLYWELSVSDGQCGDILYTFFYSKNYENYENPVIIKMDGYRWTISNDGDIVSSNEGRNQLPTDSCGKQRKIKTLNLQKGIGIFM